MKLTFLKKEPVLTVSWGLAIVSAFFVHPSKEYISYIDWRSLGILWGLMVIMQGLQYEGMFETIGNKLLQKTHRVWQLCAVLIGLCFVGSMFITNDVALLTFVPFAILLLIECDRKDLMIPVIVLQTIAANLGSMMTPIGNPQNLYLYGLSGMPMRIFIAHMLPWTAISLVALIICLVLMKGKNDAVQVKDKDDSHIRSRKRMLIYLAMFVIALLVVARILPWPILVIVVLILTAIMKPAILRRADYCLLLTFVGFFIFTGNVGRIPVLQQALASLVGGREVWIGVLTSQCISNVPAALLLSGFTGDYKSLLLGVNIGGLGTMIASMASLISYKLYANTYPAGKGRYFRYFTRMNIIFLVILLGVYAIVRAVGIL